MFSSKIEATPEVNSKNNKISIKIDMEPQNLFFKFGGFAWSKIMRFSKDRKHTSKAARKRTEIRAIVVVTDRRLYWEHLVLYGHRLAL